MFEPAAPRMRDLRDCIASQTAVDRSRADTMEDLIGKPAIGARNGGVYFFVGLEPFRP
jgi:hypothetical protein